LIVQTNRFFARRRSIFMSEQENTRIAEKFFSAFNAHDLSQTKALEAPNYKAKAPGSPEAMTGDESRAYNQGFLTAFPDLNFELTEKIAQGDFVVINWIARGTHNGNMRTPAGGTIPPTHKKAAVHGSTTFEIKNGKAVRSWVFWDMVTLLTQLGLMPAM
jgi:steroid delta-isomerase-like uncharacterized protein